MSFPTKPAFVHYGTWDATTRSHPAMKFMETYTREVIDKRRFDLPYSEWHTDDFSAHKADGDVVHGGEEAWAELEKVYHMLTGHLHEPYFLMCSETDEGYDMIGQAMLYAGLPGQPAQGESKVKDLSGKEWDVKIPGGFHFLYVKDDKAKNGQGFKLKKTEIMSDSGPLMMALLRRGVIKPSDLGL